MTPTYAKNKKVFQVKQNSQSYDNTARTPASQLSTGKW